MDHRRFHGLEKMLVQLTALVALAGVYFIAWPLLRPTDPQSPVSFLLNESRAHLIAFALVVWGMAALVAVVTISARPGAAMMTTLIGAGAVSMRSYSLTGLLWYRQDSLGGMYGRFITEIFLLAAVAIVAAIIVELVRRVILAMAPQLAWQNPLAIPAEPDSDPAAPDEYARQAAKKEEWIRAGMCLAIGLAVSVFLLLFLMQSTDRGQVLFAVAASFLVASVVAHQMFPTSNGMVAWLLPILSAVGFYALAATSVISGRASSWREVPLYGMALPVDWMTLGIGAAMAGFWVSQRIHEVKHFERIEERKGHEHG